MPVDWFLPLLVLVGIAVILLAIWYRRRSVWIAAVVVEIAIIGIFWIGYIRPGQILRAAALKGDATAMYHLSLYYRSRLGYRYPDRRASLYWLEQAASRQQPDALTDLGRIYEWGDPYLGINVDWRKAMELYWRAAAMGNPDAEERLRRLEFKQSASRRSVTPETP